ncbi:C-type lectin 1-like [Mytilus galloprovincialis]|uniref:C-type lectin 1-like n=1 Tax=Mytilus galloprovincialis TaxID=29158 RepID=UPI003F7B84E8
MTCLVVYLWLIELAFVSATMYCDNSSWQLEGTRCYKVILHQSSGVIYQEGKELCRDEHFNSTLVMPKTAEENTVIELFESIVGWFWIGLTDFDGNNKWTWEDGSSATFTDWINGNPDNALEQCVTLAWGGWHDNYCTALRGVICQLDAVYQESTTSMTSSTQTTNIQQSTSDEEAELSTNEPCLCNCDSPTSEPYPTHASTVDTNTLILNKYYLSSAVRRRTSASDPRRSSFYIGCVGVAVLVITISFVILLDFLPRG